MVGKQTINNCQEIFIPKLKAWWHSKKVYIHFQSISHEDCINCPPIPKAKLSEIGASRMECDYKLVENEGLFQEYLEMGKVGCRNHMRRLSSAILISNPLNSVLQFGFITIFVAAFPLAPFFALLVSDSNFKLIVNETFCNFKV